MGRAGLRTCSAGFPSSKSHRIHVPLRCVAFGNNVLVRSSPNFAPGAASLAQRAPRATRRIRTTTTNCRQEVRWWSLGKACLTLPSACHRMAYEWIKPDIVGSASSSFVTKTRAKFARISRSGVLVGRWHAARISIPETHRSLESLKRTAFRRSKMASSTGALGRDLTPASPKRILYL